MSESVTGILWLVGLSVLTAISFHWKVRRYLLASLGAALTASSLFQVVDWLHLGYLDPFFLVALVVGGAVAFIIAALIGIPFWYVRKIA